MACHDFIHVAEARETIQAQDNSISFLHTDIVLKSAPATPDKRTRRKSMSRRSGQSGYIEKKGNAFYVRFWIDVPGQEKRAHKSIRICPTTGLGKMTKPERERRAKQIIAESGADTEEHLKAVQAVNLGVTFRKQAEWFLDHVKTRKRRPIKPATATSWASHLTWIKSVLGEMPLASVNNLAVKELVSQMAVAGFSPKTMHNYVQVVKMVVASAVNEQGEEIYPRKWNHEFIDLCLPKTSSGPLRLPQGPCNMLHSPLCILLISNVLLVLARHRLGSRAGTHREEEKNKNILTGRKKNILDTHRPSHGRP